MEVQAAIVCHRTTSIWIYELATLILVRDARTKHTTTESRKSLANKKYGK